MSKNKFSKGQSFTLRGFGWTEGKGVRELKGGPTSSERLGGEYPDIELDEVLTCVEVMGSTRAIVTRGAGVRGPNRIVMHINHINPTNPYYALRGTKSQEQKSVAERKQEAIAKIQQAKKELEELVALQAEAEAMAVDEASNLADEEQVSDAARDEAAALFEQAV